MVADVSNLQTQLYRGYIYLYLFISIFIYSLVMVADVSSLQTQLGKCVVDGEERKVRNKQKWVGGGQFGQQCAE